ncbi:hypothetical protein HOLleu_27700 [Holothuria leucospilota]|uniref:Uncharacterized protein n=1 Tax=Holothuria leucospilota TaxID=206669 RepID=A0A9Q1BR11_HOLLE|nr:hypothetical protein HOLleu_27700 [Holothuria leucospilota]
MRFLTVVVLCCLLTTMAVCTVEARPHCEGRWPCPCLGSFPCTPFKRRWTPKSGFKRAVSIGTDTVYTGGIMSQSLNMHCDRKK